MIPFTRRKKERDRIHADTDGQDGWIKAIVAPVTCEINAVKLHTYILSLLAEETLHMHTVIPYMVMLSVAKVFYCYLTTCVCVCLLTS